MKRWIWVGSSIGVAALAAGLVWLENPFSSPAEHEEGADKSAPSLRARRVVDPVKQARVSQDIESLLRDNSSQAWNKIVELYAGASDETKRKVLAHIAQDGNLGSTLHRILATVGDDPLPPEEDPMVAEAAEVLRSRWKKVEDVTQGRQVMLGQRTEKRQWVVAKALITAMKDVGPESPLYGQKTRVSAKLVDLHSTMQSGFIRSEIANGVSDLGNKDAALILARGSAVTDDDLEVVREERATRDAILEQAP